MQSMPIAFGNLFGIVKRESAVDSGYRPIFCLAKGELGVAWE
jgi:hypothetical protein